MSTEMIVSTDNAANGVQQENKSGMLGSFRGTDMMRQITMILALAICLAIAIFVMMWAQEPEYRPLGKYEAQEMIQVLDVLDKNKIPYKVDFDVLRVPDDKYQDIRLLLSRAGVEASGGGAEKDYLTQDMGFGVSQRLEQARLKHSQEQTLARAIEELKSVSRAKVILALPKENVFARNKSQPSATVVVTVRRGALGQEEVDSIVDIVASAVQGLEPTRVTVTDSNGRLLNSGSQDGASARARRELELVKQKEAEYRAKVDAILMPILGPENFTSQVDVSMDFTAVEQTAKRFNPDLPAVRSEMTLETQSSGEGNMGIPGALSNQPPMESNIPQTLAQAQAEKQANGNSHKEATRNFELDTTISHTRQQIGTVRRVSVSVAVDYKTGDANAEGQVSRVARTETELANIRRLLEGAVGFSGQRGDSIEVVTVPFMDQLVEEMPELPLWEQPWFWKAMKLASGSLAILFLILFVVRPLLKKLLLTDKVDMPDDGRLGHELAEIEDQFAADTLGMLNSNDSEYSYADDGSILIPNLRKDDDMIKAIRALVANEPELSTQVVKTWLQQDNG